MSETRHVSALMLERYRLGEVSAEERKFVDAELAADPELRLRNEGLEVSDRELRERYPHFSISKRRNDTGREGFGRFRAGRRLWGICAAAVFLCALFPSLYYLRSRNSAVLELSGVLQNGPDRIKGTALKTGLSLYLMEKTATTASPASEGSELSDRTLLREGNTVQLAYTTPPGIVCYGVIFSIDGRSALTLHYPYHKGQNPLLTVGKRTFLSEAYTLDDAPDFETFFMVVSQSPLDTEKVLKTAGELAKDPKTALSKSAAAFDGCEVEVITIRK